MNRKKKTSLVESFEEIWRLGEDSHLTREYFKSVKASTDYVKEVLGISPVQCFFVAALLNSDEALSMKRIGDLASVSYIKMMTYESEFKDLIRRQILERRAVCVYGKSTNGYELSNEVLKSIRENTPFKPHPYNEYNSKEVLKKICGWLDDCDRDNDLFDSMVEQIKDLLNATQQTSFSSRLSVIPLKEEELSLFLIAAWKQVFQFSSCITPSDYNDILEGSKYCDDVVDILSTVNDGTNNLVKFGLLECETRDGTAIRGAFHLMDKACSTILEDFNFHPNNNSQVSTDLKSAESFGAKELFYNEREAKEIRTLADLLSQEKFSDIQKRLREAGLRPGFACLFWGAPGTGKTETVQQLSRMTGRPVFQVDVSNIKSKWVGESESNMQQIFERYDNMCSKCSVTPILFFNEADSILGKRMDGATAAVEKMENSIQNILLQGFEKQKGIIICTTNLAQNLDDAFERRFIYKVRFDKPDEDVKAKIWKSMLPGLTEPDAQELAHCYDFSGGQIENIARKQNVDHILYNTPVCLDAIKELCAAETLTQKATANRKPIGFR